MSEKTEYIVKNCTENWEAVPPNLQHCRYINYPVCNNEYCTCNVLGRKHISNVCQHGIVLASNEHKCNGCESVCKVVVR